MLVGLPLTGLATDLPERVLPAVSLCLAVPELQPLQRMLRATSAREVEEALSPLVECDRTWRIRSDAGDAHLIWQLEATPQKQSLQLKKTTARAKL
jgi:hypothetical protein